MRLREMILAGELPGGARIAELALVDLLGVSRTPIRAALVRLEQEGLLESLRNGGFAVRTFSENDASDAIELRGTVEGMAARLAAERGAPAAVLAGASACLARIDDVLARPALDDDAFLAYVTLNREFHQLLSEMSGSAVVQREIERVVNLPFASPSAFVVLQANAPRARDMLVVAQDQHRQVLEAITRREGSRAEALMREHSRIARRNLGEVMRQRAEDLARMPAARLIRKRSP
nr:GntR family transcriptional regulator [Caenimonas aquaedulcis]